MNKYESKSWKYSAGNALFGGNLICLLLSGRIFYICRLSSVNLQDSMSFFSWTTVNWLWERDYSQVPQPIISKQPHGGHFQSLQSPASLSPLSETLDGECATVVRSIYLKVGYSHSCNHSKHNKEHPSDDRLWNGDENCSKFSKDSQNEHENSGHLEDHSAAHLSKISRRTHPIQIFFMSCFHSESYD